MSKKNKVSRTIGRGLAHVQSFVDDALHGAFNFLKKSGSKHSTPPDPNHPIKSKLKTGLKKTAKFLGETGDSFYEKYEDLNAKKREDRKNKK